MEKCKNEQEKVIKRLERIIYNMSEYLNDLYKNTPDDNYKHHKAVFGITKEEYNKFFKGEN